MELAQAMKQKGIPTPDLSTLCGSGNALPLILLLLSCEWLLGYVAVATPETLPQIIENRADLDLVPLPALNNQVLLQVA